MFITASVLEAQQNRLMNQMSGKAAPGFTPKQGQYLAFIDAYTRVNRRPPAERDIQHYFGVTPPTVHQMILTLERNGFIRRTPGGPRSIKVLVAPEQLPTLLDPDHPVKIPVQRY
jgi:DNA-binding MarR family transcriptional regulator